jgi:hypothetical protein
VKFQVPSPQRLSGVLKDPDGAVVWNLKMKLSCAGEQKVTQTDGYGRFDFGQVQPGECMLTFDPGPWLAPTIKCSPESCAVEPLLSFKHDSYPKIIEN